MDFDTLGGKSVKLTVKREGAETEIPFTFGSRDFLEYTLVEISSATAAQKKIRDGWLKR